MRKGTCFTVIASLALLGGGAAVCAQDGGIAGTVPPLSTVQIASGLTSPVFITAPPGDTNRLFVVELRSASTGRIRVINLAVDPPVLQSTIYLSISPVSTSSEQGLLGLAFHPDFLNNGYFYVNYTNPSTQIVRYRANAPYATSTTANATGTTLLTIAQPEANHNGGWIAFGPDGHLYIATGDGGGANDQHSSPCATGNAQCITSLLGKMLRIDVDGADNIPGNDDDDGIIGNGSTGGYTSPPTNPYFGPTAGLDQILHIGLRNPWRCSFDRQTGDLYIGDVGQNAREEVSFAPAGAIGRNFGWRCMEGLLCTGLSGCTCNSPALTNPIHSYNWTGGAAVTGGYVYRGSVIPNLSGTYFFADHGQNQAWSFRYNGVSVTEFQSRTAQLGPVSSVASFGEDANGEMYIAKRAAGTIWRIIPQPPANNTCAGATLVTAGSHNFSNLYATTTGPSEAAGGCFDTNQIHNDVWYRYVADCSDTLTVSVCDANIDTRVAIYGATCSATANLALACSDDSCGTGSSVSLPVTAGTTYRIRVGGTMGSWGSGTLNINCGPIPCPSDLAPTGGGDGQTNVDDLLVLLAAWGPCSKDCSADLAPNGGDGQINVDDLLVLLAAWGPCE